MSGEYPEQSANLPSLTSDEWADKVVQDRAIQLRQGIFPPCLTEELTESHPGGNAIQKLTERGHGLMPYKDYSHGPHGREVIAIVALNGIQVS